MPYFYAINSYIMIYRKAKREDVPAIVEMLAADNLGATREDYCDPLPQSYYTAFEKISSNPIQELIVAEDNDGNLVATLQLTFIQYLTYQGGTRLLVENVRVRHDKRGQGIGEALFKWVIERGKTEGAFLIQLTSDFRRVDAIRFYERLGFKNTHAGMKLLLKQ
ncbi:MAG TPA: GNAT family N-acetyltransferase [Chitinophaga sp.]|uniref:GNAT family N-acetyltransferase n=1 Tax=Chitinophaga sp. TaxID=1869181 RepID=UPI002D032F4D|nr:GNAT family N-acetyltransferase [Chitinophaga sp.]HVI46340.1 GNAT family N-acetyltransferase [Chitinophaga sp.]